jgi:hypothetical protein
MKSCPTNACKRAQKMIADRRSGQIVDGRMAEKPGRPGRKGDEGEDEGLANRG